MEKKIYIQLTGEFVPVAEETFYSFYNSCSAERKQLQKEGKCFCPQKRVWQCDSNCVHCPFSPKPEPNTESEETSDETEKGSAADNLEKCIDNIVLKQLIEKLTEVYPEAGTVIWLRYMGYSDREIEKKIHIPRRTFEFHINSALKKLNVHIEDYR